MVFVGIMIVAILVIFMLVGITVIISSDISAEIEELERIQEWAKEELEKRGVEIYGK